MIKKALFIICLFVLSISVTIQANAACTCGQSYEQVAFDACYDDWVIKEGFCKDTLNLCLDRCPTELSICYDQCILDGGTTESCNSECIGLNEECTPEYTTDCMNCYNDCICFWFKEWKRCADETCI